MNYTELKAAVQDFTENVYSDTDFATMTRLAEQKIYNSVQLPALRKSVDLTLTSTDPYLDLPDDFLAAFSIAVIKATGEYEYLLNKDVNFIRAAYSSPSTLGLPRYYAIFGPQAAVASSLRLILGPTPDFDYPAELHYFHYPESIVTAGTTWLGENFDSVLFNAVMVEAARFMKAEADIVQSYDAQFAQSLALVKQLGDVRNLKDAYRSGALTQRGA